MEAVRIVEVQKNAAFRNHEKIYHTVLSIYTSAPLTDLCFKFIFLIGSYNIIFVHIY